MQLLTLREAAQRLGYTEKGFRRIVDRSRAKAMGAKVRGPVIKFMQAGPCQPIRFREEWLEEFVDRNTVDATPEIVRLETGRTQAKKQPGRTQQDEDCFDLLNLA